MSVAWHLSLVLENLLLSLSNVVSVPVSAFCPSHPTHGCLPSSPLSHSVFQFGKFPLISLPVLCSEPFSPTVATPYKLIRCFSCLRYQFLFLVFLLDFSLEFLLCACDMNLILFIIQFFLFILFYFTGFLCVGFSRLSW